jgi:hypothetical protein
MEANDIYIFKFIINSKHIDMEVIQSQILVKTLEY